MSLSVRQKDVACFFLFCCLCFFPVYLNTLKAETTADVQVAEQARTAFLDPELKAQKALAETLKEHEKVWLELVYPETNETKKVLAIIKSSLIPEKQGAVLILHDKEQHANWPQVISPIRSKLPKYGWYTLAVNLPDDVRVQLPERELQAKTLDQITLNETIKKNLESGVRSATPGDNQASGESTPGQENTKTANTTAETGADEAVDINLASASESKTKTILPYAQRALVHIEKAMEHLKQESYQNIVLLAHRHSAELALEYIKAHSGELSSPGFALILVEPRLAESYLLDMTKWLGQSFAPPIMDIVNTSDPMSENFSEERKLAFLRAGVRSYRQAFVSINQSEQFHDGLVKRIKSWLETAAPGMTLSPK